MHVRQPPQDAIGLLKADHRKVENLFEQFEKARDKSRREKLVKQICLELTIHTIIEEEIFYPACAGQMEDEDLVDEAYVEHDGAKVLVSELSNSDPENKFYDAKVSVLSELIKHRQGGGEALRGPVRRGQGSRPRHERAGRAADAA